MVVETLAVKAKVSGWILSFEFVLWFFVKLIKKHSNQGEGIGEGGDKKPRQRRFRRGPRSFGSGGGGDGGGRDGRDGGSRGGGGGGGGGRSYRRGPRKSENGDGVNGKLI